MAKTIQRVIPKSSQLKSEFNSFNSMSSFKLNLSSTNSLINTFLFVITIIIVLTTVEGQPLELHRSYDHRSAMNTLKELDKYYSQMARPRFGKRDFPISNSVEMWNQKSNGFEQNYDDQQQQQQLILDQGPYRWLLINREQPLTKLTENYLLEILADNLDKQQKRQEKVKQELTNLKSST